jgi:ketosteroid isomerase-like protein
MVLIERGNPMRISLASALSILLAAPANSHPNETSPTKIVTTAVTPAARAAADIVDAFHAALGRGDTKAALGFLAEGALIYESGGAERSKAEYASHHLGADAAFAQAVPAKITRRAGEARGDTAWIASEGRTTGTWKGKAVDLVTTETMVLRRIATSWKIVHVHWSSGIAGK